MPTLCSLLGVLLLCGEGWQYLGCGGAGVVQPRCVLRRPVEGFTHECSAILCLAFFLCCVMGGGTFLCCAVWEWCEWVVVIRSERMVLVCVCKSVLTLLDWELGTIGHALGSAEVKGVWSAHSLL